LVLPAGPSAVRNLEFKLEAADLPVALRFTVLEMTFDDKSTGCFFGIDAVELINPEETK
jgi:hypothetical protein